MEHLKPVWGKHQGGRTWVQCVAQQAATYHKAKKKSVCKEGELQKVMQGGRAVSSLSVFAWRLVSLSWISSDFTANFMICTLCMWHKTNYLRVVVIVWRGPSGILFSGFPSFKYIVWPLIRRNLEIQLLKPLTRSLARINDTNCNGCL